jgi:hypothetical protein
MYDENGVGEIIRISYLTINHFMSWKFMIEIEQVDYEDVSERDKNDE